MSVGDADSLAFAVRTYPPSTAVRSVTWDDFIAMSVAVRETLPSRCWTAVTVLDALPDQSADIASICLSV